MNLAICSLASGSSGNCYLVMTRKTKLLVDAGISARRIKTELEGLGIQPGELKAIVITHEHTDHIQGLKTLSKQTDAEVFATGRTIESFPFDADELQCGFEEIVPGKAFCIGDINIEPFKLSHDAACPVGFRFESGGKSISLVTDTGVVKSNVIDRIQGSDIVVLEANHDENVLRMGRYPWFLKQRILSDKGHLSNEAAGGVAAELAGRRGSNQQMMILLAHLSRENNFPEMAVQTVSNILEENGYPVGKDIKIQTLKRSERSILYQV